MDIIQAIESAKIQFEKLVIIVGHSESSKQTMIDLIKQSHQFEIVNLNLELSTRLLELSTKARPVKVLDLINDIITPASEGIVLDRIDILFDISLQIEPLTMLQSLSRNRIVIAFWNGYAQDGKLIYAKPSHQEYRSYQITDFTVLDINTTEDFLT